MTLLSDKRVCIVLGTLRMGGSERQALHVAEHLSRQHGAKVTVWGLSGEGPVARHCEALGIPWLVVPFRWPCRKSTFVRTGWRFARQLRRVRPEILLPYTSWANIACGLWWRHAGAGVAIWNQRSVPLDKPTRLERWAARNVKCLAANSGAAADYVSRQFGIDRSRMATIHNGVDLPRPRWDRAAWRTRLGLSDDTPVACMVANLRQAKDHATLLAAWERLRNSGAAAAPKLLLAGDYQESAIDVRRMIEQRRLSKDVSLLGPIDDIAGLLEAADFGVHSAHWESSPNAVLEMMSRGLPVVATDLPGIREAVGCGGEELLFPAGDARRLAELARRVAEDALLRHRVGQANARRVRSEFSLPAMLHQTTDLIVQQWMGTCGPGCSRNSSTPAATRFRERFRKPVQWSSDHV